MGLSKKERLILINQYQILKKLYPENLSYFDEIIEILEEGYEIFYDSLFNSIFDEMPIDKSRIVLDILDIYRIIEDYKEKNSKDDDVIKNSWSFFNGFDGNNESEYLGFTRFLIEKQHKFTEQLKYKKDTDSFNSHKRITLSKYKSMIEKWDELGRKYSLNRDEILEILNAGQNP